MSLQENVARGIALLDAVGPKDWRETIDVTQLRLTNTGCVLGQLYGDMAVGSMELSLDTTYKYCDNRLEKYGFNPSPSEGSEPLWIEWRRQLERKAD